MGVRAHRISNDETLQRRLRRGRSRFDAAVTLRMYRGVIFEQSKQIRYLLAERSDRTQRLCATCRRLHSCGIGAQLARWREQTKRPADDIGCSEWWDKQGM